MDTVVVNELTKTFDTTPVLRDMSFTLPQKSFLVVTGPSGCGKTTLLRLLAGLETPDTGEIFLEGRRASAPGRVQIPPHRRNLGFIFQSPALWPHMTVEQNILFGLKDMGKKEATERMTELMDKSAIGHLSGRYPDEISGGEARRVALARSLAPRPFCLLADEPLTNLDVALKDRLLEFTLQTIASGGSSLIYVTHDMEEASRVSTRRVDLSGSGGEENRA